MVQGSPKALPGNPSQALARSRPAPKQLRIAVNYFIGSLPREALGLAHMRAMEEFVVLMNFFEGTMPDEVGSLRVMQVFGFASNKFIGSFPEALFWLPQVQKLSGHNNNFTGSFPEALTAMQALDHLWLDSNSFDSYLPDSLAALSALRNFLVADNHLAGALPDALGSMLSLIDIRLYGNRISGSLPGSLSRLQLVKQFVGSGNGLEGRIPEALHVMQACEFLWIEINKFIGSLPNVLDQMRAMYALGVAQNSLSSTLPEGLSSMRRLREVWFGTNTLSGIFPDSLVVLQLIKELTGHDNNLKGSFPDAVGSMQALERLWFSSNKFTGSFPHALFCLQQVAELEFSDNQISGALPDVLGRLRSLRQLVIVQTLLTGSLTEAVHGLRSLLALHAGHNLLTGELPDLHGDLIWFEVGHNDLRGTIPSILGSLLALERLFVHGNGLTGSLPGNAAMVRSLKALHLSENALSGSVPATLCSSTSLVLLGLSKNNLEGTLPVCLCGLASLYYLVITGDGQRPRLRGSFPPCLVDCEFLAMLIGADQQLEGSIPAFKSTLHFLVLRRNSLRSITSLHFRHSARVLVDHNRLSCRLPADNESYVKASLVAVGNHLMWSGSGLGDSLPSYVLPHERDGLFWFHRDAGMRLMMKVVMSCSCLLLVLAFRVGPRSCLDIWQRWHAASGVLGLIAKFTSALLSFMVSQVLGVCLLLIMVVGCDYYICPSTLTLASACLLQSSTVQSLAIVIWSRFCVEAQKSWWMLIDPNRTPAEKSGWRSMARGCFLWTSWILAVLMLSGLAVISVALKCVPSFLPAGSDWIRLADMAVGIFQGSLSSVVLPRLAKTIGEGTLVPRTTLLSVANMLSSCLIPILVALYMDGACFARWTLWWLPCTGESAQMFDIDYGIPMQYGKWIGHVRDYTTDVQVLRKRDLCMPRASRDVASCVRSVALKLQDLCVGKMVTAGLGLPALRLLSGRHVRRSGNIVMKLALLLELGLLLGAPLPLLVPLLWVGIQSDGLLAAVALHKGALKNVSEQGDVQLALKITWVCSVLFHAGFACGDLFASILQGLAVVVVLANELRQ